MSGIGAMALGKMLRPGGRENNESVLMALFYTVWTGLWLDMKQGHIIINEYLHGVALDNLSRG